MTCPVLHVYNASDFGAGEQSRRTGASVSSDAVALFTAEEDSFYVGSGTLGSMDLEIGVLNNYHLMGVTPFDGLVL